MDMRFSSIPDESVYSRRVLPNLLARRQAAVSIIGMCGAIRRYGLWRGLINAESNTEA